MTLKDLEMEYVIEVDKKTMMPEKSSKCAKIEDIKADIIKTCNELEKDKIGHYQTFELDMRSHKKESLMEWAGIKEKDLEWAKW